jgi:hypothetical protein
LARRAVIALVLGACAAFPAAAHAGSYDVYSCKVSSSFYGNNAWVSSISPAGGNPALFTADATCAAPGDVLVAALQPSVSYAPASSAALALSAPTNTRITDYTMTLRQLYTAAGLNMDPNTPFVMTTFGPYAFTLAGNYDGGVINYVTADAHYWGAAGPIDRTVTLSKADSPHSSVIQGTAPTLALYAGCWSGRTAVCSLGASDVVQTQLIGSRVTIEDAQPPVLSALKSGTGLLTPGTRSGAEPVAFSATDNTGIRRSEIIDVTETANPKVVASEDYNSGPNTDAGTRCDYTRPRPCPDLKEETIAASPAIAGHRTLLLRVTDAGGETTVSAPFSIFARGPVNGANGGDGARLVAGFPAKVFRGKGKKRHAVFVLRSSRTVSYGKTAKIRGILRGASGQAIGGADLRILVREARLGGRNTSIAAASPPAPTGASSSACPPAARACCGWHIAPTTATTPSSRARPRRSTPARASASAAPSGSARAGSRSSAAASWARPSRHAG